MTMYIWLDDIRDMPKSALECFDRCVHTRSVSQTKETITAAEAGGVGDFVLDLDHDLGDYAPDGGDAVKLVLWLIETGRNNSHYKVRLHTANPVGHENMQALIERYWEE